MRKSPAHERASIGETAVAIFHHGYSRRVAGVIRLCHRYSFYSFNAEKFNSFYSKINEWPQCVPVVYSCSPCPVLQFHSDEYGGESPKRNYCERRNFRREFNFVAFV